MPNSTLIGRAGNPNVQTGKRFSSFQTAPFFVNGERPEDLDANGLEALRSVLWEMLHGNRQNGEAESGVVSLDVEFVNVQTLDGPAMDVQRINMTGLDLHPLAVDAKLLHQFSTVPVGPNVAADEFKTESRLTRLRRTFLEPKLSMVHATIAAVILLILNAVFPGLPI